MIAGVHSNQMLSFQLCANSKTQGISVTRIVPSRRRQTSELHGRLSARALGPGHSTGKVIQVYETDTTGPLLMVQKSGGVNSPVEVGRIFLIIYKGLGYIPGGCLGFLPSTVSHSALHLQLIGFESKGGKPSPLHTFAMASTTSITCFAHHCAQTLCLQFL